MPRPRKPARLYQRPDTGEWVIRDGAKAIRTGFRGPGGLEAAEKELARYLSSSLTIPTAPEAPSDLPVETAVAFYLTRLADAPEGEERAAPERQAYAWQAMAPFWGGKTCAEVTEQSTKDYARWRHEGGDLDEERRAVSWTTARRELGMLRAALNASHRGGILTSSPIVWLPPKGEPRPDWLTRAELARLIWELWQGPRHRREDGALGPRSRRTQHAARLVLAGAYAGSRPRTTARTTWRERRDGPWVDLESGVWHRRGKDEPATVKSRKPFRASDRLIAHLRRWERLRGGTYIVEHPRHPGEPVLDIGKSIDAAARRAGIEKRITPHTIKHTAITLFIQGGGSAEDASEIFSTSLQTIQSTYWHHSPEHQRRAAEQAGRLGRTDTHRNPAKRTEMRATAGSKR